MKVLVTGGAGYIGSHTCVELLKVGHSVVIYDNFCNSNPNTVQHIEEIAANTLECIQGDIRDRVSIEKAISHHHCARPPTAARLGRDSHYMNLATAPDCSDQTWASPLS